LLASNHGKLVLLIPILFLCSCGTEYNPEESENEVAKNESVPADETLETVTWNLEWFGRSDVDSETDIGLSDEMQEIANILKVADSLKADLYAFQEIYDEERLKDLINNMSEYKGFVGNHIDYNQKTAFVYNTNTIDSLRAGPITHGQDEHAWAGRLPLYFNFDFTYQNTTREFYAIVIHAKAFADQESYHRRMNAAEDLYRYLMEQRPNSNIILLGDYNDDVDVSIYEGTETPYHQFVDNENFKVVTGVLSEANHSSTVGYPDMIDHIAMSNELFTSYVDESAEVFTVTEDFVPDYEETTSDHYPVWAKFDVMK
jgi:endonuclease/exonuclease/phosphatase family metal-dependent hydrolase